MTTPPTTARKAQINTLILALKAAGVWTLLDVFYVTAAADSQAARLNWKNPATFTALTVNSPTFAADRGYTGDGASSRLRTQFTPSVNGVNLVQDSASIWVWSRTDGQSTATDIGSATAPSLRLVLRNASDQFGTIVNDATLSQRTGSTDATGFFGASRAVAGTKKHWRNGVQFGADTAVSSTAVATQEAWVCGSNSTSFSARQQSVAAWGAALTGKEAAFYSAVLAYLQAVGAA